MDYQSQIYLFREKLFHVITIFHARARNKFPFLFKFLNANFEVARNFYLASSVLPRSSVQIFIDNSANFCSRRGGRRERNFREPRVSLSEYFDEWGGGGYVGLQANKLHTIPRCYETSIESKESEIEARLSRPFRRKIDSLRCIRCISRVYYTFTKWRSQCSTRWDIFRFEWN